MDVLVGQEVCPGRCAGMVQLVRRYHRHDTCVRSLVSLGTNIHHMPHLSVRYPTYQFESDRSLKRCSAHVPDNGVTLACHVLESLAVNHNDPAPTILNDARLFELAATKVTVVRRTPSICDRNSWVSGRTSLSIRSRV